MINQTTKKSQLASYVNLLVQLHRLIVAGKGDSEEADELRDRMDAPWTRMSEPEVRLTNNLAEDLYHLDRAETFDNIGPARALVNLHLLELADLHESPESDRLRTILEERWLNMNAESQDFMTGLSADLRLIGNGSSQATTTPAVVAESFAAATRTQDWSCALTVLREHGNQVPSIELAAMCGICWDNLGYREVASVFFGDALHRMPTNIVLQTLYFRSLLRTGQFAAATANALFVAQFNTSPYASLLAADILFQCAVRPDAQTSDAEALKLVAGSVERLPIDAIMAETDPLLRSIAFVGYWSASRAFERLGEHSRAKEMHRIAAWLSDVDHQGLPPATEQPAHDLIVEVGDHRHLVDSNLLAAIPALASH